MDDLDKEKLVYSCNPGFFVDIQAQKAGMKPGISCTGVILLCQPKFLYIITSMACIDGFKSVDRIRVLCSDGSRTLVPAKNISMCGRFIVLSCSFDKPIDIEIVKSVIFEDAKLTRDEIVHTIYLKDFEDNAEMTLGAVGKSEEDFFIHNCRAGTHTAHGSPTFNEKGCFVGLCYETICGILVASTVKSIKNDLSKLYRQAGMGIHELLQHISASDTNNTAGMASGSNNRASWETDGPQDFPSNRRNEDISYLSQPDLALPLCSKRQFQENSSDNYEQCKRRNTNRTSSQQAHLKMQLISCIRSPGEVKVLGPYKLQEQPQSTKLELEIERAQQHQITERQLHIPKQQHHQQNAQHQLQLINNTTDANLVQHQMSTEQQLHITEQQLQISEQQLQLHITEQQLQIPEQQYLQLIPQEQLLIGCTIDANVIQQPQLSHLVNNFQKLLKSCVQVTSEVNEGQAILHLSMYIPGFCTAFQLSGNFAIAEIGSANVTKRLLTKGNEVTAPMYTVNNQCIVSVYRWSWSAIKINHDRIAQMTVSSVLATIPEYCTPLSATRRMVIIKRRKMTPISIKDLGSKRVTDGSNGCEIQHKDASVGSVTRSKTGAEWHLRSHASTSKLNLSNVFSDVEFRGLADVENLNDEICPETLSLSFRWWPQEMQDNPLGDYMDLLLDTRDQVDEDHRCLVVFSRTCSFVVFWA